MKILDISTMSSSHISLKTPLQPTPPSIQTYRHLTEDQKYLMTHGWPIHCFDFPVEVIPGLWLSGVAFEHDLPTWCHKNGFTHILNAAGSYSQKMFYHIHHNEYGIKYLGLDIDDTVGYPLQPYMSHAQDFIEHGLNEKGKILIHCVWGQSRSVSCLIYFMMMKWNIKYDSALEIIRKVRPNAQPNSGFDMQLRKIDMTRRITS